MKAYMEYDELIKNHAIKKNTFLLYTTPILHITISDKKKLSIEIMRKHD